MKDIEFWRLIATLEHEDDIDDEDIALSPLVEILATLPAEAICEFDDKLAEKVFALDGERFVKGAGIAGEFDDLFLDARLCVVANGKTFFEKVLDDPDQMPEQRFGALLFAAERAYVLRTGEDYEHEPPTSIEKGAHQANWP